MPRYYFHLHEPTQLTRDDFGLDLPDLARARVEAVRGVRSVLSEEIRAGRLDLRGRIDVADREGNILLTVLIRDTVEIQRELSS